MGLDIGQGAALVAGLLLFTPRCVLPLVSPYSAFLAGSTIDEITDRAIPISIVGKVLSRAIAFVLGFSTIGVGLGASGSYFGALITDYLDILSIISGIIIIILGLHFLGVLRIGLLFSEVRFQSTAKSIGLFWCLCGGSCFRVWMDAVCWSCFGTLYAGSEADVAKGAALLLVYSLGIGIPFLLAAAFAGLFIVLMKRLRKHMGLVEKLWVDFWLSRVFFS